MKDIIDIEVVLDSRCRDPKVKIFTEKRTTETERIVYAIENVQLEGYPPILGLRDEITEVVHQRDIIRALVDKRSTVLYCVDGTFAVKKKLSELENVLNPDRFVRISQSEIINLRKVKGFDFSVMGTIGIEYDDGTRSWVSRRYVKHLRETLTGINRPAHGSADSSAEGRA